MLMMLQASEVLEVDDDWDKTAIKKAWLQQPCEGAYVALQLAAASVALSTPIYYRSISQSLAARG